MVLTGPHTVAMPHCNFSAQQSMHACIAVHTAAKLLGVSNGMRSTNCETQTVHLYSFFRVALRRSLVCAEGGRSGTAFLCPLGTA